jgi:NADH-quinone oxidoreductase subunit C
LIQQNTMSAEDLENVKGRFGDSVVSTTEFRGEHTVNVRIGALHDVLAYCRDSLGYNFLLDLSSLDHFGAEPRFEVVYELATVDDSKHLRVKSAVAEGASVPTATDLWSGADWHEREVWDMMGVPFAGHPNLKRILMWEGYPFHPLRKDFPLAGRPSEMPEVAVTGVASLEGGPFVTVAGAGNCVTREPRARVVE